MTWAAALERRRRSTDGLAALDLAAFVPAITPAFAPPTHLAPLLDLLRRAEHEPVRACVSVPPRHSKTESVLHAIAWLLRRHPDWPVGYVSYAADIARSKSRQARDYAARAGVTLREDAAALHEWRTPEGGGVLATGIGGPLTGHGVRVLVCDDPFKNRADADSPTVREHVHRWWTSTAMTRVEPGGSVLVVHTRWHRDDLIGRLSRDTDVAWEVINLPAIDPARGGDGSLWPERWPAHELDLRRREVGEHDWQSLYQGHPVARQGRVFPAFTHATHVAAHAALEREYAPGGRWRFRRVVVGVDWGYTHIGAMVVVGVTGAGRLVVIHEECHRGMLVSETGWLAVAKRLARDYRPDLFTADPSEPGYIRALREALAGEPVVVNAHNDVSEGIRRVSVALEPRADGAPGMLVSERCPRVIEEFETWSYRTAHGELSETPQDTGDDAMDALRYAVMAATRGLET